MKHIPQHILDSAISYATYRTNADREIALPESEKTDQQRLMADYTRQNVQRMKRWHRTMTLSQETMERALLLDRPVILLTRGFEDELTYPEGANVRWTFGERTERPRARLPKCPIAHQQQSDIR
jgi:hypothetical protein